MLSIPPRYLAIGLGAAGIAILAALFYFNGFNLGLHREAGQPPELPAIAPGTSTAPAPAPSRVEGPPTRLIALYQGEAITSLNPDPAVAARVPEARLQQFHDDLAKLAASVNEDPLLIEDWLSIGFIKKFFNNYAGARDAWEYAKLVRPEDARVWHNLGMLYSLYLKVPGLAEQNLKAAIRLDPLEASYWTALADLYRYGTPPRLAAAVTVIQDAIKKLPDDLNLRTYFAELYVAQGEKARAIAEYEKALTILGSSDAALKFAIEAALSRLRQ